MNGRVSLKKYTDVYLLNSLPTLIELGRKKFVVFSHCGKAGNPDKKDKERFLGGPTLYFYDVDASKETKRLKGGEALINFKSEVRDAKDELREGYGRLFVLGNAEMMKLPMWSHDYILRADEDAVKYEAAAAVDGSAIVFTLVANFD